MKSWKIKLFSMQINLVLPLGSNAGGRLVFLHIDTLSGITSPWMLVKVVELEEE